MGVFVNLGDYVVSTNKSDIKFLRLDMPYEKNKFPDHQEALGSVSLQWDNATLKQVQ